MLRSLSRFILLLLVIAALGWAQNASPVIRYANILGGSGSDTPTAVTVDAAGNIYILGQTRSADFPSAKRLSPASTNTYNDVFVVKVDPTGRNLLYSAVVSAGEAAAMAIDAAGSVYVAGRNPADTLPLKPGAISATGQCFLFKLNPTGSDLVYSTRLPCGDWDGTAQIGPAALAVDSGGAAYLAGYARNVTTTPGAYMSGQSAGPFAMKVNPQGSALVYSTYLAGADTYTSARRYAVAVDAQGNLYLTGATTTRTLTATVQPLPSDQSQYSLDDVVVLELSATGSKLVFSTLFGGPGDDFGQAIGVDAEGFIYVSGNSHVPVGVISDQPAQPPVPFPTTPGAFDRDSGTRAFLVKLAPSGAAAVFSTFLPDISVGSCIGVSQAGVDVLGSGASSYNHLLRVSGDGTALINSSLVSLNGAICGQHGGAFALASSEGRLTSADLTPIGPRGPADVWFSIIEADSPNAPVFSIDTSQLILHTVPGDTSKTVTIHAGASGGSAQFAVSGYSRVSVNPSRGAAPADVVITAPGGSYSDSLTFFAPGAHDGLVSVPVGMLLTNITLDAQPLSNRLLALSATGPDAPPVTAMLHVTSTASADIFGTPTSAKLPFTVQLDSPAPSWLKIDLTSGTTPAALRVTADPAGLKAGSTYYTWIHLRGPAVPPGWPGQPQLKLDITVRFTVGPVAPPRPPGPTLISEPWQLSFRLTPDQPSASATVRLTSSTGEPVDFKVDPTPDWLTVTPSSGTTPADLKLTAAVAQVNNSYYEYFLQIRRTSDNVVAGAAMVTATAIKPDYVGHLSAWDVSTDVTSPYGTPRFAPGGLFNLGVDKLLPTPANSFQAPVGALVFSAAGFSFKLNDLPVPLRSYQSGSRSFVAQIPPELEPGTYTLDQFDSSGARIATGQMTISPVAPRYVLSPLRGLRADGSTADATNPVRPGEHILLNVTGQGDVQPAVPGGSAAPAGVDATPVSRVTAIIGGKAATVVSALMSHSEAGVLEVTLEVPNLISGDYFLTIWVGIQQVSLTVPLKVLAGPQVPQIQAGGVVNAASYLPQIAPGSLFSIFGSGLAAGVAEASTVPLPMSIGGVSVTIAGKQAPLLFVSPGQINGQVPYEVAPDPAAPVVVTVNGASSSAGLLNVVPAAPGIFEFGQNRAVVQNQDYSLNSADNGAAPRSTAIAYLTGSGALDTPVATGSPAPLSPLSKALEKVTATVNGMPADVTFAGLAPTLIGVMQVNFVVPDLPPGTYPVVFTMSGGMSNSAVITVI